MLHKEREFFIKTVVDSLREQRLSVTFGSNFNAPHKQKVVYSKRKRTHANNAVAFFMMIPPEFFCTSVLLLSLSYAFPKIVIFLLSGNERNRIKPSRIAGSVM